MKNTHIINFSLLVLLLLSFSVLADEKNIPPCNKGFQDIETQTNALIASPEITADSVAALRAYISECISKASSLSQGKRDAFRELITSLTHRVAGVEASLGIKKITATDKEPFEQRIKLLNDVRQNLQTAQYILSEHLPLDTGWGKDFSFHFYLGFEGTTVSGVKAKGTARTGMSVYNELSGPPPEGWHWGVHAFANIVLTSSAEQTGQDTTNSTTVEPAAEMDLNLFFPGYGRKQQSMGVLAIGPIITFTLRKPDNTSEFTRKYMGGIRAAHSQESFFDILYGKTEKLDGKRVELRGQLPVAKMLNGNLFVGTIVNISANNESENNDSLRLYVTWQVNVPDIFDVK